MSGSTFTLAELGWNAAFSHDFEERKLQGSIPGRVASEHRGLYDVFTEEGLVEAAVAGRFRNQTDADARFPAVGDWAVIVPVKGEPKGIIHAVLAERSRFSRQAAGGRARVSGGRTQEQIVAANVDTVFIVGALDEGRSSNMRRIERYLTLAWNSGATPVVVLNKADLCHDISGFVGSLDTVTAGVDVLVVSAVTKTGLDDLRKYVKPGSTVAFLGSSGVGKSALINALLGFERQEVKEVRGRDYTGKHTTTSRELILVPGGGLVIDTPGMREIQMWAGDDDLGETFEDISSLAEKCRFRNCRHRAEPGCAVKAAIDRGDLEADRLDSYERLRREIRHHEARQAGSLRLEEKLRWKKIAKAQRTRKDEMT